ncbi:MAG TPA: NAD-dependent epimerase/dehydratase family protein, partial [Saprospiraceae bacterium]|nr:NAD-dependent epimerase/dehydratase family protein [Saprospiraceae bacterium]
GATGFLGSYLTRLLVREGWRVRALRRADSRMHLVADVADQVEWAEADVTDVVALEDAFEGVTRVCHCAATVSFHPRDRKRMMQVNVEGTANVVNLALEYGAEQLIHTSSIAAVGRGKENTHLDEGATWLNGEHTSAYALSKYLSEQEAWRGHFEGLPTAVVNPSIILGSGVWSAGSGRFFQQIASGLAFWPTGQAAFVDVRDVARFMLLLLERQVAGERYILAAENLPYRDFLEQVANELGKKPPRYRASPWMLGLAWRADWLKEKLTGLPPLVTRETARSSTSPYTYESRKSLSLPGFAYRPLAQTVQETAQQFLASQAAGRDWAALPV